MSGREAGLQMLEAVKSYVSRALGPVSARLDKLDEGIALSRKEVHDNIIEWKATLPTPKDGEPGQPGKDATPEMVAEVVGPIFEAESASLKEELATHVVALIKQAVAELPPPKDGAAGSDGKDATPEMVAAVVEPLFALQCSLIEKELSTRVMALVQQAVTKAIDAEPKAPASFSINQAGNLVAVYPNGETKDIGRVQGEDGRAGAAVMDVSVDTDGQLIQRMSDGRILNAGIVRGAPGKDAEAGPQGAPGRDSLEIVPLPALDEEKSYPEGTCALYRGGMLRAERQTDPMADGDVIKAGWRVMLEGIADESEEEFDDGRVVERSTTYTSGRVFSRKVTTTKMIDRGVWRAGEFKRGDVTSWDGSIWVAQATTTDKPGNSAGWRLAVKRGRDGRNFDDPQSKAGGVVRLK